MGERPHDVAGAGSVCAVLGRDKEGALDFLTEGRIGSRPKREERAEIALVGDFVKDLDGRIDRGDELYRPFPGNALRLEFSLGDCFRQASAPGGRKMREGLIESDHPRSHDVEWRPAREK